MENIFIINNNLRINIFVDDENVIFWLIFVSNISDHIFLKEN